MMTWVVDLLRRNLPPASSTYPASSRCWSATITTEFSDRLTNRVVNLVPIADITKVPRWVNESTQTVGIYPERLREQLRDDLARHGVQRIVPFGSTVIPGEKGDPEQTMGLPHDGSFPMMHMVRWVIDESEAV